MIDVQVDVEKCTGCGSCVPICPSKVFRMTDGKADPYKFDECVDCQSCVETCEAGAITVTAY